MKTFLLLALVAACTAVPILQPKANWVEVNEKVDVIRTSIGITLESIKVAANNDNPTVGFNITEKLDSAIQSTLDVLVMAQAEIDREALTVSRAETYFTLLEVLLTNGQSAVADDVAQLSQDVQITINVSMENLFIQIEAISLEVYKLLETIDYTAVQAKMDELKMLFNVSWTSILNEANADNPVVAAQMAVVINSAVIDAGAIVEAAEGAIASETLTLEQAQIWLQGLEILLSNVQIVLQDEVDQLSSSVQDHIRSVFDQAFVSALAIADEIYDLLRVDPTIDYPAIQAKVDELHAFVNASWTSILTEANADNPAVAAQMAVVINAAVIDARAILEAAEDAITSESLTLEQAQVWLQGLEKLLRDVQIVLQDEVDQLSSDVQDQIQNVFNNAFATAVSIADEIYDLLRPGKHL